MSSFSVEPFLSLNEVFADLRSLDPIEDTLSRTVELVVRAVGCDAGSVSLSDDEGLRTIAATDDRVVEADKTQYAAGDGPCVEAARNGEVFVIHDMAQDHRWESFSTSAFGLGFKSSLSVPLRWEGRSSGALNLYATSTNAFGDGNSQVASLFASRIAIGLGHAEILQRAIRAAAEGARESRRDRSG